MSEVVTSRQRNIPVLLALCEGNPHQGPVMDPKPNAWQSVLSGPVITRSRMTWWLCKDSGCECIGEYGPCYTGTAFGEYCPRYNGAGFVSSQFKYQDQWEPKVVNMSWCNVVVTCGTAGCHASDDKVGIITTLDFHWVFRRWMHKNTDVDTSLISLFSLLQVLWSRRMIATGRSCVSVWPVPWPL